MIYQDERGTRFEPDRDRRLSAGEFDAWVNAPWTEQELADALALVEWFSRRYPTPLARLEAGRRAARRARELAASRAAPVR